RRDRDLVGRDLAVLHELLAEARVGEPVRARALDAHHRAVLEPHRARPLDLEEERVEPAREPDELETTAVELALELDLATGERARPLGRSPERPAVLLGARPRALVAGRVVGREEDRP